MEPNQVDKRISKWENCACPGEPLFPANQAGALLWEDMAEYINPKRMFLGCFIPNWLRSRTELTMTAKVLYGTLMQHANDDGVAWPSSPDPPP